MDLDTDGDTLTTALLAKKSAKKEDTNEVVTEPVPFCKVFIAFIRSAKKPLFSGYFKLKMR